MATGTLSSSQSHIETFSVETENGGKDSSLNSTEAITSNSCKVPFICRKLYNRRGVCVALMAAIFLSSQNFPIKFAHKDVPVLEIAFTQMLLQAFLVIPIMVHKQISPNFNSKSRILVLLILRGVFGVTGSCLLYYSLRYMNIADVTAISYSSPVVSLILARILLGEAFGIVEALLVLLNVAGVVLITQPPLIFNGNEVNLWATLAAVTSCVGFSLSFIVCRQLGLLSIPSQVIVLYHGTVGVLCMAVLNTALGSWVIPPCDNTRLFLVLAGVFGFAGQCSLTYAFRLERTVLVNVINSNEVLFAYVIQFLFLGVMPDLLAVIGAVLIVIASSCTAARRQNSGEDGKEEIPISEAESQVPVELTDF